MTSMCHLPTLMCLIVHRVLKPQQGHTSPPLPDRTRYVAFIFTNFFSNRKCFANAPTPQTH